MCVLFTSVSQAPIVFLRGHNSSRALKHVFTVPDMRELSTELKPMRLTQEGAALINYHSPNYASDDRGKFSAGKFHGARG